MSETILPYTPDIIGLPYGTTIQAEYGNSSPLVNPSSVIDYSDKQIAIDVRKRVVEMSVDRGATFISPDTFGARHLDSQQRYRETVAQQFGISDGVLAKRGDLGRVKRGMWAGPAGDCWKYDERTSEDEIANFHERQAEAARRHEAVALFETVNSKNQAIGIAKAARTKGLERLYISFVVNPDGVLMGDKSRLVNVIEEVIKIHPGVNFGLNCARTKGIEMALTGLPSELQRLVTVCYPNGSEQCDPWEAEATLTEITSDHPKEVAQRVVGIGLEHKMKLLGVCCGNTPAALEAIVKKIRTQLGENIVAR